MATVTIRRDGKRWAVYVNDTMIEGGFFSRAAAVRAAEEYREANRAPSRES